MVKLYYKVIGPSSFKRNVENILSDSRGWKKYGYNFKRRNNIRSYGKHNGNIYFSIKLMEDDEISRLFPTVSNQNDKLSVCDMYNHKIYINNFRWYNGSKASKLPLDMYRHYVINHEVGHILGKYHRRSCTPDGNTPVMMQQTKGTYGCTPNPFPSDQDAENTRY